MVKLVMFDMDGVLFDSMPRHSKAWRQVFLENGLDIPESEIYLNEGRTGNVTIDLAFRKHLGRCAPEEAFRRLYAQKCAIVDKMGPMPPMAGAYEAVQAVRACGLDAIVVTGSGQAKMLKLIDSAYDGLFKTEWLVCANDVKKCKPDPEPYLTGLRKAGGLLPNEAIVVENAPLGVQAGKAAGCYTIAVNTGILPDKLLIDSGADILFHSMDELARNFSDVLSKIVL